MGHFMEPLGPWPGDDKPGIVNLRQIGVWGEELLTVVLEFLPIWSENELFVWAVHQLRQGVHDVSSLRAHTLQCNQWSPLHCLQENKRPVYGAAGPRAQWARPVASADRSPESALEKRTARPSRGPLLQFWDVLFGAMTLLSVSWVSSVL